MDVGARDERDLAMSSTMTSPSASIESATRLSSDGQLERALQ
jgi:hypothetical protein